MSGILHRLAAQAMGLASPVRAAARLPFAPLPPLVPGATLASPPGSEPAVALQSGERRAPVPDTGPRFALHEPATPGATPDDPPGSEPVVVRRSGERRAPVPETESRFALREPAAAPPAVTAGDPRSSRSPGQTPVVEPPPQVMAETPGRDGRPAPHPSVAMRSIRTPAAMSREVVLEGEFRGDAPEGSRPGSERAAADVTHTPLPESLLPPVRSATRDAGRAALGAQTPGRSGPVEETTEVHVSIGRIEVTAVHEAPLAKRAAPRRAEPMTLEQYLARKRGGRP